MGSQERREREKRDVRARILDAARELFVRDGYEAVSMRRIAQRIDYSATALYFHFTDKESLLRELCHVDFLALAHVFYELAQISDPVERLRRIGLTYVQFGLEHPNHYRLMFMTPHPPTLPDEAAIQKGNPETDAYAFFMATIRDCIAAGRFRPEYDDADLLAQMLWAAMHGIVALHIIMGGDATWVDWRPAMHTGETSMDTLTRGLLRSEA